jgi:hypothetical protein
MDPPFFAKRKMAERAGFEPALSVTIYKIGISNTSCFSTANCLVYLSLTHKPTSMNNSLKKTRRHQTYGSFRVNAWTTMNFIVHIRNILTKP